MSEDNTQTISEELLRTSIIDAAKNIATDSDAMRLNMMRIADALLPIIKQSGIRFGGSQTWNSAGHARLTCRIGVRNDKGRWTIGVERSSSVGANVFSEEIYDATAPKLAEMRSFSVINRDDLAQAVGLMPNFLEEYLNELDSRSVEYADLRKKAEAIRAIMEG